MAPRKTLEAKRSEKDELRKMRSVTITIEASENNLQRLAAFMLFADRLDEDIKYVEEGPLPWEEPAPAEPKPISETIDFNVVRHSIVKQLEQYVAQHGAEKAKEVIRSFGAERLSQLPEEQLLPLYEALKQATPENDA
jgi:hypothetical protein